MISVVLFWVSLRRGEGFTLLFTLLASNQSVFVPVGATDPTTAPKGSVRRSILDQYKALGLKSKPNTGDNGVHASASPFEALAERANWLGADIESDPFGKGLMAAGLSKKTIENWSGDAQVSVAGETSPGKTMSVFDTLEDLDADAVLYVSYCDLCSSRNHIVLTVFFPLQDKGHSNFRVRSEIKNVY
jgi:hypothetical protein